jgi:hypothetical protein
MKSGPRTEYVLWMAAGAVITAVALLVGWHFRQDPAQLVASKATRADLVGRLQLALTSAELNGIPPMKANAARADSGSWRNRFTTPSSVVRGFP